MTLHTLIALSFMVIASDCFGGFGPKTIIKVPRYNEKLFRFFEDNSHIFRKASMLHTILKEQGPLYPLESGYAYVRTQEEIDIITLKEVAAQNLIAIGLNEAQKNAVFVDILCHPLQKFYKENSSRTDCSLSYASDLKPGDSIICFEGATITSQMVHQLYRVHNQQGTVLVPQTNKPMLLLASQFGAVSYVPGTVDIKEEQ